jgi:hypothetical protein
VEDLRKELKDYPGIQPQAATVDKPFSAKHVQMV